MTRQTDRKPEAATSPARGARKSRRIGTGRAAIAGAGGRLGRLASGGARQVAENPITAALGAATIGAGIALLLPVTRREAEVLGPLADTLEDVARGATESAIDIGRQEVKQLAQTAIAGVGGAMVESMLAGDTATGGKS